VPGIMIMQVNGSVAGQTVPHVHFHIIPRRVGERLLIHAAVRADGEQLRVNAERIRRCLAAP
jgi:histidine triad (HIT) family protein